MSNVAYALLLSFVAGISTSIGGILGLLNRKPNARFISFMMAFSGGVMVFVSFTEMFAEAEEFLGMSYALLLLSIGMLVAFCIDKLIPDAENVHDHIYNGNGFEKSARNSNIEVENSYNPWKFNYLSDDPNLNPLVEQNISEKLNEPLIPDEKALESVIPSGDKQLIQRHKMKRRYRLQKRQRMQKRLRQRNLAKCKDMFCVDEKKFMKLGVLTALALFIHNVPEGIATFSASLVNVALGLQITVAIALHNIPEGISVAIPVYIATKSKKKAMLYTILSGIAEPLGAVLAWLILSPFLNDIMLMGLLALVAGIMIYISVDVLIPTAKALEFKHTSILGFTIGMITMGVSIILL